MDVCEGSGSNDAPARVKIVSRRRRRGFYFYESIVSNAILALLLIGAAVFYFGIYRPGRNAYKKPEDARQYIPLGRFVVTGYEASEISCGKYADGKTALSMGVAKGIAAVDPRIIPIGSTIYIDDKENGGYFLAADTGGLIKRQRVDIFFPTHQEAMKFGRRTRKVYLVNIHRSVDRWKDDRLRYLEAKNERRKKGN